MQVTSLPQTLREFDCGLCGKINSKSDFMKHRKLEHIKMGSECKENTSGGCRYSIDDCWFKHNEKEKSDIQKSDIQNSDIQNFDTI